MSTLPDLRVIVHRFNGACRAFDEAIAAMQARDAGRHDMGLVQAARDMGSALELAVLRGFGLARPEQLEATRKLSFPELVDQCCTAHPPLLGVGQARLLKAWKKLRNRAEHAPIQVPRLRDLLEALRGTRRFLIETIGEIEDLADPDHPTSSAPPAPVASIPALIDDAHREQGPAAWVEARLDEGLQRLKAAHDRPAPLEKDYVQDSLLRLARALAKAGEDPGGVIPDAAVDRLGADHRLYVEAGWLTEGDPRFRDPRLPALLVGLNFASRPNDTASARTMLGGRRAWAEAAWAATAAGDPAQAWLQPLTESTELERLPDRVLTACAAMAGLAWKGGLLAADIVEPAAACAGAALVWLAPPVDPNRHTTAHPPEPWNAWVLDHEEWHRALLDLALGTEPLSPSKAPVDWKRPGGPLERLVTTLGLTPRLSDEAALIVLGLGRPWPSDAGSPLDDGFFTLLFSLQGDLAGRIDLPFAEAWLVQCGIRALRQADPRGAARRLVTEGPGHLPGLLLRSEVLLPEWCEAWQRFAGTESAEDAARAWVLGATVAARSEKVDDGVADFLLRHAPDRLRELRAWEVARERLEGALSPAFLRTQPTAQQVRYGAALLALVELTAAQWREKIEAWSAGPQLPWRPLLDAGAPHDAIARWCVDKLRQKKREAPNLDGPPGIVATGMEVLAAGPWQVAFRQAPEAFDWLVAHGDEGAVAVLAEACFATDEAERYNPVVGKLANLHVPFSQVLWGRVLERRAGRAAFYARIERGMQIGYAHFLPDSPLLSITDGLWTALTARLIEPFVQTPHTPRDDEVAEARRIHAAFERWRLDQPATPWHPQPSKWGDAALREAKTLIVYCSALHGLDVAEPLTELLQGVVHDAHPHEADLLTFLGAALDVLCQRPEPPPPALLTLAASPLVAKQLATDTTHAFWAALLCELGVEAVASLVDALGLPDLGLGLFDALASVAPEALDQWQERPDLLRAVLLRSAEGRFQPSRSFHERAWATPRQPAHIRDLDQIPAGDWLEALVEQSRRWSCTERDAFLRTLAQRSRDLEVRRRCLGALLDDALRA